MGLIRRICVARVALIALASLAGCGEAPTIQDTTRLGDTFDREGPYTVRVVIGNPESADTVSLVYRAGDSGTDQRVGMAGLRQGIYEATISGQPAFTRVRYHVEVADGGTTVTDPPEAARGKGFFGFWVLGSRCTASADCLPGERCDSSGVCRTRGGPCLVDGDCGKGFSCGDAGRCRLVSRACTFDQGCLLGEVCDVLLGACVPRPLCADGLTCPLDFLCDDGASPRVCRRRCAGNTDCLPGERCDSKAICRPSVACRESAQCTAGLVCDPLLGLCRTRGAEPCATCAADADCGGPNDHCLVVAKTLRCGKDCSRNGCPPGYSCDATRALPQCRPTGGTCP